MLLTVVINNYNYSRFVGASILSVLRQTYEDFQLLVVDDGSSDSSREVISSFSDPRMHLIFKTNGGQCSAFQAGLSAAEGQYIALLDSDDEWNANKLEKCVSILTSHPDICLLQHSHEIINDIGDVTEVALSCPSGYYDPWPDYQLLKHHDLPFFPTSCIIGKASAFKRLVLDAEAWRIDADTPVIAGLSVLGPTYFINEPLTRYRKHGSNATAQTSWMEMLERRKRFYNSVNEHIPLTGRKGYFNFENSDDYILGRISSSKWYRPRGFLARLRYRVKCLGIL